MLRPPKQAQVDDASSNSFPASDPPAWSGVHSGAPCPADEAEELLRGSGVTPRQDDYKVEPKP